MILVEIDPELAALATENIARNGLDRRVRAVTLDVTAPADEFAAPRHRVRHAPIAC